MFLKGALTVKTLQILFYCLVGVFVVSIVRDADLNRLGQVNWRFDYLIGAVLVAVIFRYAGVVTWINILRQIGCAQLPSFSVLASVYAKAWMGRYIPGKIAWILGKVVFGSRYGISVDRLAVGSVLEAMLQMVTMFVFSLLLIVLDSRLNVLGGWSIPVVAVIVCVFLVVLMPTCFRALMQLAYKLSGRKPADTIEITSQLILSSCGLYAVGFLISGYSYFLLINAVYDIALSEVFFIVAAFNLAGVAGMIVLFAPSGLGVREGVLLLLLPIVLPKEIALLVIVLARIFSLAVDLGFFLVCHLPGNRQIQKTVR